MKFSIIVGFVLVAVAGCTPAEKTIFVRLDGQRAADNPALQIAYQTDFQACQGRAGVPAAQAPEVRTIGGAIDRVDALKAVIAGCMAEKGYLAVPESKAAETHQKILAARRASR